MNAEYSNAGKLAQFSVTPEDGIAPHTVKITERSTCGKWILEHVVIYRHYDVTRDVAVYTLSSTGKRPA
jgi:hypothetical protein